MSPLLTRICLNMIVRNEAHVIRRCLDSVRPVIDRWVIVDTGSSDGTQDLIRAHFRDIPGELHERPWRDFGTNRTEALALARGQADYVLIMDADHELHAPDPGLFRSLTADGYFIAHRYAGVEYGIATLLADRLPWRYEGVLHEYATADAPHLIVPLPGPWVVVYHEGARSRDPQTYARDAAVLEAALAREPGNTRYAFYLAQSLKDAGRLEQARDAYARRAALAGFDEEIWFSLFQRAILAERLGFAPAAVEREYLDAFRARPSRAEPLVELARYLRLQRQWPFAYLHALAASRIPKPPDMLFIDEAAYRWRALDEVASTASYAGADAEGLRAAERLVAEAAFPPSERARIEANLAFYRARRDAAPAGSGGL